MEELETYSLSYVQFDQLEGFYDTLGALKRKIMSEDNSPELEEFIEEIENLRDAMGSLIDEIHGS